MNWIFEHMAKWPYGSLGKVSFEKKVWNFPLGGGGPDQFWSFSHFFFSTLNHANMLRNNVHGGGEGCSLYKKNNFPFNKYFLCYVLKKSRSFTLLGGEGSGPKVWNFTLFFEWDLPKVKFSKYS